MSESMNRVMISVPEDVRAQIEQLKMTKYYDRPYAEIYRQLIKLGLEKMDAENKPDNSK
jgi:metal-responsive CopG/Arc/MetJ family transcriptional regulator